MTYRLAILAILLAVTGLLAEAHPSRADWLVTEDGHRVETRGSWRVDGEVVLFELPSGGLVSMRLDEVNLEASRQLTAGKPPEVEADSQAASATPESVFRLTDADVRHVPDDAAAAVESADPVDDGGTEAVGSSSQGLKVTDWSEESDPAVEGLVIVGTLENSGVDTSGNIHLVTRLYDVDGAFIASATARLTKVALPPGETARFRAEIPGVFTFSAVRFETESLSFEPTDLPSVEEEIGERDFGG